MVHGCEVSPLVWSIFVGQNADLTSGLDCTVLNKSQPAFVGFWILKHKKATDVFFSQIHLELLQRIVSLCRILQIVLGN